MNTNLTKEDAAQRELNRVYRQQEQGAAEARKRLTREHRNGYIGIALGLLMMVAGFWLIGAGATGVGAIIGVLLLGGLAVIATGAYAAGKRPST